MSCCRDCGYFQGGAAEIEAALPGLASLSSAYAAVRADDGLCGIHDRYVAGSSGCAQFAAVTALRLAPGSRRISVPFPNP
jgi:hypothetical protein